MSVQSLTTPTPARIVTVRQNILKKNDLQAHDLRRTFAERGVLVVNLVSSPGAGKTTLLRETLRRLGQEYRVAALVGDLATDNDAQLLAQSGAPAIQIVTGTVCHLDAEMIERKLPEVPLDLDFLFIENVGNLVCPSSYDLGEDLRAVLFSTTEGEDKPAKYPTIVNSADLALITKMDLAPHVDFDLERMSGYLRDARPDIGILTVSTRAGEGLEPWLDLLRQRLELKRATQGQPQPV